MFEKFIKAILFISTLSHSLTQGIKFGEENSEKIPDSCLLPSNELGVCKPFTNCNFMQSQIDEGVIFYPDIICGWQIRDTGHNESLVCCPKETTVSTKIVPVYDVSRPVDDFLKYCGIPIYTDTYDLLNIYKANETAEKFEKMGFKVTPIIVDEDLLQVYEISNNTYSEEIVAQTVYAAVGGTAARRVVTVHMAIIGNVVKNDPDWYCDGVIINRHWVLSAAHCFIEKNPDIVRLGEYDLRNDTITSNEFPMNFGIKNVIIYPEYQYPSAYHDLALIELDRAIPYHRPDMRPICLPWGKGGDRNLIGEKITLTGWGATIYGGPSSPVVQEVNVTVFDPLVCDRSYSKLPDYSEKFPKGITKETSLCAGDVLGGKDSCQGDSGGPVVYIGDYDLYTLAGIVSTGYGCGRKEFPGIYVPIDKPQYLSWIKKIAFAKI